MLCLLPGRQDKSFLNPLKWFHFVFEDDLMPRSFHVFVDEWLNLNPTCLELQ